MNKQPKVSNAILWKDLKTSVDLTDFITDQMQDDDKDYITKTWIANTLEILKNEEASEITDELIQVAKLMKEKNITYILL